MVKKVNPDVAWCIHFAQQNAKYLYEIGKLDQRGAEEWIRVESLVRARMLRKRKQWPSDKIERKVKARIALRKLWSVGKHAPWRPFGGALSSVGESLERLANHMQKEVEKELTNG